MTDVIKIADLLKMLRQQLPTIVATAALVLAIGAGVSALTEQTYSAVAEVLIRDGLGTFGQGTESSSATDRARDIQNEIAFAQSDEVVRAAETIAGGDDHDYVILPKPNADVLLFAAREPTAEGAAAVANAYATAYVQAREKLTEDTFVAAQDAIQKQLQLLDSQIEDAAPDSPFSESLREQRSQLITQAGEIDLLRQTGSKGTAQLTRAAELPEEASAPNWSKNLTLSLVLGVVLGLTVALLRIAGLGGPKETEK